MIDEILKEYDKFHRLVENTPDYVLGTPEYLADKSIPWNVAFDGSKDHEYFMQLHAAMGMAGEAGEILEPFKKNLFGKRKPIDVNVLKDELGDLFWYFWLMLRTAPELDFKEILEYNVAKLSARYSERLGGDNANGNRAG